MEDKFVLGGKEFKSRFILGSGKYNLHFDVQILRKRIISWISSRKESHFFQIHLVREMPKKLSESQG